MVPRGSVLHTCKIAQSCYIPWYHKVVEKDVLASSRIQPQSSPTVCWARNLCSQLTKLSNLFLTQFLRYFYFPSSSSHSFFYSCFRVFSDYEWIPIGLDLSRRDLLKAIQPLTMLPHFTTVRQSNGHRPPHALYKLLFDFVPDHICSGLVENLAAPRVLTEEVHYASVVLCDFYQSSIPRV